MHRSITLVLTHLAPALACAMALAGCASSPSSEAVPSDNGAISPGVLSSPVLSVEPWDFVQGQGQVIRTRHYRLYTTEEDPVLLSRLPGFLETALEHYRTAVTPLPAPPLRLDTYLMDNRTQWRTLSRLLAPDRADQYDTIPRGGYATGGVGVFYDIGVYDTMAIAAHEGWHQYVQRTFREPLPIWMDEGLASYMEGHRWAGASPVFMPWANVERFDRLRADVSTGTIIPLDRLLEMRPAEEIGNASGSALTYYAQVWALIHFLREGEGGAYRAPLRDMIADAAEGRMARAVSTRSSQFRFEGRRSLRIGPAVFTAYFGEDLETHARRYEAFLKRIVAPGSRGAVVAGRSPLRRQTTGEPRP